MKTHKVTAGTGRRSARFPLGSVPLSETVEGAFPVHGRDRLRPPRRTGQSVLLALGTIALESLLSGTAARAQGCNPNPNPSPPAPITYDLPPGNYSSDSTPAFNLTTYGLPGCDGQTGTPGQPGLPGLPSAGITSTSNSVSLTGSFLVVNPFLDKTQIFRVGGYLLTQGGIGGIGGQGVNGGDGAIGGTGGVAGSITAAFSGSLQPSALNPSSDVGLWLVSLGGSGGAGGAETGTILDTGPKIGGMAGSAASGGSVTLTAGGTIRGSSSALIAESVGGNGGRGGYGDTTQEQGAQSVSGNGGNGGNGGSASVEWTQGQITAAPSPINPSAISARSAGGDAGNGENAGPIILDNSGTGGNGGTGGKGGAASVLLSGGSLEVTSGGADIPVTAGVIVQSVGGLGGTGGNPSGSNKIGGNGGNGGAGGSATATILATINVAPPPPNTFDGQGVLVQSTGGFGGNGASESGRGQAGGGGFAGAGGSASVIIGNATNQGTISVTGGFVQGAVVQSVGGGGGKAGTVSWGGWSADGGAGADGGTATLTAPNAQVTASGINGTAAIIQSLGGGGGVGGDVTSKGAGVSLAIGGNGGNGGKGGPVNIALGTGSFQQIGTAGGGLLAQSVGGAGGAAGNAYAYAAGAIAYAIGGTGGTGGSAGPVTVSNGALIGTNGEHAAGLTAQSIGGGGGKGGAAVSFDAGVGIATAVAIGGTGGAGGSGGAVTLTDNTGQIITYGSDAPAVVLQSIGGGGGAGGSAAARAISISPNPDVPAISVTVANGGKGGSGNTAGAVGLTNSGLITTGGDGSMGVIAQSIGGGGGIGGDSTANSVATGSSTAPVKLTVSVAMGGTGGAGGNVTLANSGLLATFGQDAYGVFAQSVGGGGGIAGAGDASSSSDKAKGSVSATIAIGGSGGVGGVAGQVQLTNTGAITTSGDGSDAVFAQSVGGGGGAGGGGVATASGGTLSMSLGLGGKGGGGNDGNTATALNSGSIVTRGTDAIGLSVQSVGGGGGKGGKGGATAGGTTEVGSAGALFNILSNGLGLGQPFIDLGNDFVRIGRDGERILASAQQLAGILSQPQAAAKEIGTAVQLNVAVGVGGGGGAGGEGGVVNATNTGVIQTFGAQSDGIYAQSVGGGGGSGGAATSTTAAATDKPAQTAIAVGGTGNSGGDGGPVTVVNGSGGAILTQGVAAVGIFAQSVGGGGGEGAAAGSVSGSFKSISASLGGNGGAGGLGSRVLVTTGDGGSTIDTTGKHGIGILAQSIGGGGGVVRTMTTDMTFDPAKLAENPQGRIGDYHGLNLSFGGRNGNPSPGGEVQVTTSGPIRTAGLGAHAILAQSVGGGGGLALGGQVLDTYSPFGTPTRLAGGGSPAGDGGSVMLNLKPGTVIQTQGDGAYGILAQSIGGGGGVFGDLSQTNTCALICIGKNFLEDVVAANVGNGGNVTVSASNAQIGTLGTNATGIFAQSVGGGGGLGAINVTAEVNFVDVRAGTVNGGGAAGSVNVSLSNSSFVATAGANSTGILAQSTGSAPGSVTISIDPTSVVQATTGDAINRGAAILILDGQANQINNAGVIAARYLSNEYGTGIAIQTNTPKSSTTIVNSGTILGNYDLSDSIINLLDNRAGGVLNAPTALQLGGGLLRNAGTLHVGGIGTIGRTVLTGDLVQGGTGVLRIDTNAYTGKADLLEIRGKADLAGTIRVDAVGLRKGETDPILTATGGITLRTAVAGVALPVFVQSAVLRGNTLTLATDADFGADDASKSRNQRGLTGALQRIWDGGLPGFEQGFAGLARLPDERAYRQALDSLSGEVHASAITTQAQTAFFVQEAILDRLRFGGGEGAPGVPQLGLTGSIGTRFAPGTTLPSAYSADRPGGPAVSEVPVRPAASGYAVWGQAFGAFGETASNGNASRLTRQISGFVLGAETGAGVLADWRIGLAAGYSLSTFDVSARQSYGSVESGFGAVYARGAYGPLQLRLGAAYTGSALDTRRTVSVPGLSGAATGRSGGDTVQGFGEVGYRFDFGTGYLEPFVGAAAMRIRRDGFTERGGAAALTVFGRAYEIGTATAGLQGQAALAPLFGIDLPIVARGLIGYRRAFGDVEPRALLAFSGGGQAFPTAGVPVARDALVASAGLDLVLAAGVTVGVNYTGQVGDRAQDHAVKGLLSYRW